MSTAAKGLFGSHMQVAALLGTADLSMSQDCMCEDIMV